MKVLVTGANGFLGTWVTKRLLDEGHETHVLVRKGSDLSSLEGLKCIQEFGDITNKESVINAAKGMNAIFHLAGLIAYTPAARPKMQLVNVEGTKNAIEACQRGGVEKLVHLSSVVAIGAGFSPKEILNEQSPYNVAHLKLGYFDTKHDAEILVKEATSQGKIQSVILNPTTIYGAGDAKKGSRGTQLKVARGKFPFYTSGGANVVAVEDVVDGIISGWQKGKNGERYILSGENLFIKDLFTKIARAANVKPPSIYLPNPVLFSLGFIGDFMTKFGKSGPISSENALVASLYHWFSNEKAKKHLNFNPKPADFAIGNSIRWCKEHSLI